MACVRKKGAFVPAGPRQWFCLTAAMDKSSVLLYALFFFFPEFSFGPV
jgi:hypothetical protein